MTAAADAAADAFRRDGYAVLDALLAADEVAALRADVERRLAAAAAAGDAGACERPHNTLVPLRWDDRLVGRVLASRARVGRIGAVVGASDLRWISGYVSVKEARSPALWWHQDWWCWDHPVSYRPEAPQVALLCYLTATDERTAALRVLPGSHRVGTPLHALLPEAHGDGTAALGADHPAMADQPGQVTLALRAGDAAVIDYRLLHGTHPNRAAERRDALLLTFAPAWRVLPADVRGHLIRHPALPVEDERPDDDWAAALLPRHDGERRDLPLNRVAPAGLAIAAA